MFSPELSGAPGTASGSLAFRHFTAVPKLPLFYRMK
jgi:hypothetical protein